MLTARSQLLADLRTGPQGRHLQALRVLKSTSQASPTPSSRTQAAESSHPPVRSLLQLPARPWSSESQHGRAALALCPPPSTAHVTRPDYSFWKALRKARFCLVEISTSTCGLSSATRTSSHMF